MDHLCYMHLEQIEELNLSSHIFLQVRYKSKSGEICQVFENDFVYLATMKRPRMALLKCKVLSVAETDPDHESQISGSRKVYAVERKRRTDKTIGLIEVIAVERVRLSLDPSLVFLRSHWDSIGNITTMI